MEEIMKSGFITAWKSWGKDIAAAQGS